MSSKSTPSSSDDESKKKVSDMGETNTNAEEMSPSEGTMDSQGENKPNISAPTDKQNTEVSTESTPGPDSTMEETNDDNSSRSSSPDHEKEQEEKHVDSEHSDSTIVENSGETEAGDTPVAANDLRSGSPSDSPNDEAQTEADDKMTEEPEGATAAVPLEADDGFDRHSVNSSVKSEESRTTTSLTGDNLEMHDSGVSSAHEVEDRVSDQHKLDSFSNASTKSVESSEVSVSPVLADDTDDTTLKRHDNVEGEITPEPEAEVTLRKKDKPGDGGARPKDRNSKIRTSFRNTLNFFRKIPEKFHHKKQPKEPPPLPRELYAGIRVEGLPQHFVTKYLGKQPCKGLFGMDHIREPVDVMVRAVNQMKKGEDLPLTQTTISSTGIEATEHPKNRAKTFEPVCHPIETISYGVQDTRYPRVFAVITVSDIKVANKVTNCHAYVCNSPISARKMAMTLQLAFKEYKVDVKEKQKSFYLRSDHESEPMTEIKSDEDEDEDKTHENDVVEEKEEENTENVEVKENEDSGSINEPSENKETKEDSIEESASAI
ncbi:uncharacterized protein LOC106154026 [Lingula anatina]|uniref:Uncharacterized protein LOC106154026 n=1 Tax=Lingula anatina TaxID=7574 RepID=A0A1S3HCF3_LINAN|nr:uncharacterized protein LOC106154026 [Lingula anatina]|eukprot:XP_013383693.1 uncharacterized protein LOC106154026 [Lingula anatina]